MFTQTPPESSGVPDSIQSAEEWRVLGEKIRRACPDLYEQIFHLLVRHACGFSDEEQENMPESYLVT